MKRIGTILFVLLTSTVFCQGSATKANEYYADLNYPMAIESYEKHVTKLKNDKPDREVITNLANSYFFTNDYLKARGWYDKLYQMQGDGMSEDLFLRMLTCYRANKDVDRANELMKSYYANNPKKLKMLSYQKKCLDSLPKTVESVVNLQVNTDMADFGTVFFGNDIVFSSSRPTSETGTELYEWNNQPYLNLFVATRNKNNGQLSNAENFLQNLNSDYHDAAVAFSKDLKTVYFTRNQLTKKAKLDTDASGTSQVQILKGTISGNEVVDVVALDFNGTNYSCGHPMLSPDGKHLFFVSNMPGGYGETDLYVAEVFADGQTGAPVNLGDMVNTAGREMFPFMSGDTLFFSSDGHYGLGGLDLFSTRMAGKTNYSVPENLGEPLNSNMDDFSLIIDGQGRNGYFSSNRTGGKGDDDIYWFEWIALPQLLDYSGMVLSKNDNRPIPNATIKVYDMFNDLQFETTSDDEGNYAMELPCNAQFKAVFSKPDFSTESVDISTPEKSSASEGNNVLLTSFASIVEKEGDMEKIKVDPIYFEYNKWDITGEAITELDKVLFAMEKFPNLKIKIESHTDARGTDSYNLQLSDNRAKSTMEYLISKGISPYRIESATGFGETRPKNKCTNGIKCSEEDHYVNRRSDFVIISK